MLCGDWKNLASSNPDLHLLPFVFRMAAFPSGNTWNYKAAYVCSKAEVILGLKALWQFKDYLW